MRHMIYYLTIILIYSVIFLCDLGISFNLEFTLVTISIYIISNYIYFKHKKEIINFEFFFCLAFFVASFLAYFIIDIGEGFAFFVFSTNPRSLVKGIALAMIGYHCYLCGLQPVNSNMKCYNEEGLRALRMNSSSAKIANCICLLMFFLFLYMDGINLLNRYKGDSTGESLYLEGLLYWVLAYLVAVYTSFSSAIFSKDKGFLRNILKLDGLFLINTVVIIGFMVLSGYRSQAMHVVIPIIICYSVFVKSISSRSFLILLIGGFVLMIIIGMTRSGDQLEQEYSTISYLKDFNPANGSLGFFVEEVDRKGVTGGSNYIPQTLGIIPYLQSIVGAFVDFKSFALPSAKVYTGAFDTESGMGTHIISDIYYTFGLIGVVLFMFLLGKVCRWLSKSRSKYTFLMYIIFTGNAIFAVRVELLYGARMLAWGCFLFYVVNILAKNNNIKVCR